MEIRPQRGRKLIALQLPLQLPCNILRTSCKSCKLLILKAKLILKVAFFATSATSFATCKQAAKKLHKGARSAAGHLGGGKWAFIARKCGF
jgi:RNase P subunit RPR2